MSLVKRLLISFAWALVTFLLFFIKYYGEYESHGELPRPFLSAFYYSFLMFSASLYYLTRGNHFRKKILDPVDQWVAAGGIGRFLVLILLILLITAIAIPLIVGPFLLINYL